MIRPTPRAIIAGACGLGFALAPAIIGPTTSTLYLGFVVGMVALLGVEFLRCPSSRDLVCTPVVPPRLYVGASDPLRVRLERRRGSGFLAVTIGVDGSDHLAPLDRRIAHLTGPVDVDIPLEPLRRGIASLDEIWLRWRSPWGLLERIARRPMTATVPILPNIRAVRTRAMEIFSERELQVGLKTERFLGDGSEFDALREFTPGLDHRTIDWKASARHRRLLSRQFRAERNHQVVLALDTGRAMREPVEDLPRLDHYINAGLLLAYVGLRTGDRVGLYSFAARPGTYSAPLAGVSAIHELQRLTADLEYSDDESNYTLGLVELTRRLRRRSLIVLMTDFTDSTTAQLLLDNMHRLQRRHLILFVTLRDPELYDAAQRSPDSLSDLHHLVITRGMIRERERVIGHLRRLGVRCVDTSPRAFSIELLNSYIDVRRRELIG
ncbi:MAG: DUF58 domain-containing protein [Planctomycetes bacterium]|nr:DUF58 domain-containing protein [Planctomycetota bacterium]